jgi:hypothetical protein
MASLSNFMWLFLGGTGVGNTRENEGQCTGLVGAWLDANGKPHVWGDAKDLLSNAPSPAYNVIKNTPANFPEPGNVVIWGPSWGGGHGHCAIAIAANSRRMAAFEQNDPVGQGCLVATHDYAGVLGWLAF